MSSGTQYEVHVEQPPTYRVTTRNDLSGVQVLDLTNFLGEHGMRLAQATLDGTATEWQKISTDRRGEHLYRLTVGDLPAGVTAMTVDLLLRGGVAEVTHRWTYKQTEVRTTTEAAKVPTQVTDQVNRLVGRAVNNVLMHTVANQLKVSLEQRTQVGRQRTLQETLQTRLLSANQLQHLVRVRMGGGR